MARNINYHATVNWQINLFMTRDFDDFLHLKKYLTINDFDYLVVPVICHNVAELKGNSP